MVFKHKNSDSPFCPGHVALRQARNLFRGCLLAQGDPFKYGGQFTL